MKSIRIASPHRGRTLIWNWSSYWPYWIVLRMRNCRNQGFRVLFGWTSSSYFQEISRRFRSSLTEQKRWISVADWMQRDAIVYPRRCWSIDRVHGGLRNKSWVSANSSNGLFMIRGAISAMTETFFCVESQSRVSFIVLHRLFYVFRSLPLDKFLLAAKSEIWLRNLLRKIHHRSRVKYLETRGMIEPNAALIA